MPSRFERHPPIPPSSTASNAAIPGLHPSQHPGLEVSPRRIVRPRDASIMPPLNGSAPKGSYHREHRRSISNPFAGFGRKRDKPTAKYANWDSDDDDDDEVTYPLEPESSSPRKGAAPGNNIAEGKCQTCDATVRWPRHLKVFRCTDCLMVTDLEPTPPESKDKPPQGSQSGASKLASKGNAPKASSALWVVENADLLPQ
jgi:E3 ubiquitin-protein ligase HECTD2